MHTGNDILHSDLYSSIHLGFGRGGTRKTIFVSLVACHLTVDKSTYVAWLEPNDCHDMVWLGRSTGNALHWVFGVRVIPCVSICCEGGYCAIVEEGVLHLKHGEDTHVVRDIELVPWDAGPAGIGEDYGQL